MWEEHPEAMAGALELHDRLLADAITQGGGTVVKTTGDGAIAVFPEAHRAVVAAVDAQRQLGAESWEETGPIRVRMGVHTGDTETRSGDFFGPVMNRAARIMAAGHGGQVLLSAAAAQAVDPLPEDLSLIDLGMHRLKDLTQPEHLYQLSHPDLPANFPTPNTLDSTPNNLPLQATEFLGRRQELAAIRLMLESPSARLLTIAGPGGAGKTRLGLQTAAEMMDQFRDGAYFVDLAAETDPDAAFETIVRTLDLPIAGAGDPLEVLKSRLRDKEMLLVLDNFEQLIAAAPGVADLLMHAPDLKTIVTSRETLHIRAEQVYPVPPLSLPDPSDPVDLIAESEAVQLFMERASAAHAGTDLDEQTAPVVAEICLRLDGLPLAIELATARLNVFTPAQLLERLRDRLDVLGAGGRDLPDRQRTLWGAIGWSYELLDEDEKSLFEMMSVFSSASYEAVEAVATEVGSTGQVVDLLASLVDKSLVRRDSETRRFSMLLMIKEFAEERLGSDPERGVSFREAHGRYYSNFASRLGERLRSTERDEALGELAAEIGNLRAAWKFWVARGDVEELFQLLDGMWALHEAKGWYLAAIEVAKDTLTVLAEADQVEQWSGEELAIRAGYARALMAVRGYTPEVEDAFKEALSLADVAASPAQQAPFLRSLSSYYIFTVQMGKAVETGHRLLDIAEETGDEAIRTEGHFVIGSAIAFGDPDTALAHLDKAIASYDPTRHGSSRFRLGPSTGVSARVAAGLVQWQCGALDTAVERLDGALQFARELDHPYSLVYALHHHAFLAISRGRFEEVVADARELRAVADENEYVLWSTISTVLEGVGRTGLGEMEKGVEMTEEGVKLYQGLTTPPVFWPLVLGLRAGVHAMAGNLPRALELIDEALQVGGELVEIQPDFAIIKGDLLRQLGDRDEAQIRAMYQQAADNAAAHQLHLATLRALTRLVTLNREAGTKPDGSEELATVFDRFTEGRDEADVAAARDVLGLT